MVSTDGIGFMAIAAIAGSVVFVALQLHKRLEAEFLKKIEYELGVGRRYEAKKKVRFAKDVVEPSSNNKEYRELHSKIWINNNRVPVTVDTLKSNGRLK